MTLRSIFLALALAAAQPAAAPLFTGPVMEDPTLRRIGIDASAPEFRTLAPYELRRRYPNCFEIGRSIKDANDSRTQAAQFLVASLARHCRRPSDGPAAAETFPFLLIAEHEAYADCLEHAMGRPLPQP